MGTELSERGNPAGFRVFGRCSKIKKYESFNKIYISWAGISQESWLGTGTVACLMGNPLGTELSRARQSIYHFGFPDSLESGTWWIPCSWEPGTHMDSKFSEMEPETDISNVSLVTTSDQNLSRLLVDLIQVSRAVFRYFNESTPFKVIDDPRCKMNSYKKASHFLKIGFWVCFTMRCYYFRQKILTSVQELVCTGQIYHSKMMRNNYLSIMKPTKNEHRVNISLL